MIFSCQWLSRYVELPEQTDELAERLTAAGFAVEGVEHRDGDVLLDVDVTTNRSDCMNHLGLAREVAVIFDRPLMRPEAMLQEGAEDVADAAGVEIEDLAGCPRYVARVIRGVEVGPSPDWLVRQLEAIGQRSINNVVDITNFVLWETGQPLHAFDLGKLAESKILVRRARRAETLTTLDGESRKLDGEVLVIADAERAVALAGIMGGLESEVTEASSDVLIESAHFDPRLVRSGADRIGLRTDASHRFERGADPEACLDAATRAAELILEAAAGTLLAGAIDRRATDLRWELEGRVDAERLNAFAGVEIPGAEVERWFRGLGFGPRPTDGGALEISVPSWRYYDFKPQPGSPPGVDEGPVFEADLFEEALRLFGFDEVPASLPAGSGSDEGSSERHQGRERIRRHLAACGLAETINYAFHDLDSDRVFPALRRQGEPLQLANPLSDLYTVMRRSLLPDLIKGARYNQRRGAGNVRLFEIGHVFPGGEEEEVEAVAMVSGGRLGTPWERSHELDLFDLKGVVRSLTESFGVQLESRPADLPGFIPGTAAGLHPVGGGDEAVGYLGQIADEESTYPLFGAELDRAVLDAATGVERVVPPSRYPGVAADITLTHAQDLSWSRLAESIGRAELPDLVSFGLKDRYSGEGVPAGAVNSTIYFFFNAADRSMTQEEVNDLLGAMIEELQRSFGWTG